MRVRLSCDELGNSLSHEERNEFLIAENWKATLFNKQRENRLPKRPCQSPLACHAVFWRWEAGESLIEKLFMNLITAERVESRHSIFLMALALSHLSLLLKTNHY